MKDVVGVKGGRGFLGDFATSQEKSGFGAGGDAFVGSIGSEVERAERDGFGCEDMLVYDESYLGRDREETRILLNWWTCGWGPTS